MSKGTPSIFLKGMLLVLFSFKAFSVEKVFAEIESTTKLEVVRPKTPAPPSIFPHLSETDNFLMSVVGLVLIIIFLTCLLLNKKNEKSLFTRLKGFKGLLFLFLFFWGSLGMGHLTFADSQLQGTASVKFLGTLSLVEVPEIDLGAVPQANSETQVKDAAPFSITVEDEREDTTKAWEINVKVEPLEDKSGRKHTEAYYELAATKAHAYFKSENKDTFTQMGGAEFRETKAEKNNFNQWQNIVNVEGSKTGKGSYNFVWDKGAVLVDIPANMPTGNYLFRTHWTVQESIE
jgi:hypothetical protein